MSEDEGQKWNALADRIEELRVALIDSEEPLPEFSPVKA